MSKELENFKAIAVGGGSKMGLIVSPITINSHIRRKTNPNKESLTKINFENKISVKNINYNYKNSKELFKNLNLEINKGEMIGIIGESGSGKSTLVDLLIGLIEPKEGSIEVDDIDISKILKNWQKKNWLCSTRRFFI